MTAMSNGMLAILIILTLFAGIGFTAYIVYRLSVMNSDAREVSAEGVILVPVAVINSMEAEIESNKVEIQCLRDRLTAIEQVISAGSDSEIIRVIKNGTDC
jgi:predicted xylose isomerase-like sugar epimerase